MIQRQITADEDYVRCDKCVSGRPLNLKHSVVDIAIVGGKFVVQIGGGGRELEIVVFGQEVAEDSAHRLVIRLQLLDGAARSDVGRVGGHAVPRAHVYHSEAVELRAGTRGHAAKAEAFAAAARARLLISISFR